MALAAYSASQMPRQRPLAWAATGGRALWDGVWCANTDCMHEHESLLGKLGGNILPFNSVGD